MSSSGGAGVRTLRAAVREVPWPRDVEAVFAALAARRGCVWLDSAAGPAALARWSVLAADPSAVLVHGGNVTRLLAPSGRVLASWAGQPMEALREALARHPVAPEDAAVPMPYGPGFYGYLAYDLAPYLERTAGLSGRRDIPLPDLWFGLYEAALVLDHHEERARLVGEPGEAWAAVEAALLATLQATSGGEGRAAAPGVAPRAGPPACNLTREAFLGAVGRAREYIAAGDIFQVNLSRRFTVPAPATDLGGRPEEGLAGLYVMLRRANPAPYAAYLGLGAGRAVLSSSPELFLRLEGRRVVTRPIKGTRPRIPGDDAYNARMQQELLASAKDRAELVMIVDLERNDLGRVAAYGSVRVAEPRAVEAYAAVYHTVATVEGRLHEGRDLVHLLRATFPGGSITGAPKVRAMQIVAELEPTRRSVYTGAVGFLGPPGSGGDAAGRCTLNIAIRTLLAAGPHVHLQVGGGIVADSEPQAEFEETEAKARAILAALGL